MKIDPNAPAYPVHCQDNGPSVTYFGIPIRLAIASDKLDALIIGSGGLMPNVSYEMRGPLHKDTLSRAALAYADALIAAHNEEAA